MPGVAVARFFQSYVPLVRSGSFNLLNPRRWILYLGRLNLAVFFAGLVIHPKVGRRD